MLVMDSVTAFGQIALALLPGGLLCAWCLWAVNWKRAWPILAGGGWVAFVLLVVMGAKVWSLVDRRAITVSGITLNNFWWQLTASGILAGIALFCGWLQGVCGWTPETVNLDPPAAHDDHHGGHHGRHHH
jgi:hypothetical protein